MSRLLKIADLIKQYEKDIEELNKNEIFDKEKRLNVAAVLREVVNDLKKIIHG